jgi:hypothetical protein
VRSDHGVEAGKTLSRWIERYDIMGRPADPKFFDQVEKAKMHKEQAEVLCRQASKRRTRNALRLRSTSSTRIIAKGIRTIICPHRLNTIDAGTARDHASFVSGQGVRGEESGATGRRDGQRSPEPMRGGVAHSAWWRQSY